MHELLEKWHNLTPKQKMMIGAGLALAILYMLYKSKSTAATIPSNTVSTSASPTDSYPDYSTGGTSGAGAGSGSGTGTVTYPVVPPPAVPPQPITDPGSSGSGFPAGGGVTPISSTPAPGDYYPSYPTVSNPVSMAPPPGVPFVPTTAPSIVPGPSTTQAAPDGWTIAPAPDPWASAIQQGWNAPPTGYDQTYTAGTALSTSGDAQPQNPTYYPTGDSAWSAVNGTGSMIPQGPTSGELILGGIAAQQVGATPQSPTVYPTGDSVWGQVQGNPPAPGPITGGASSASSVPAAQPVGSPVQVDQTGGFITPRAPVNQQPTAATSSGGGGQHTALVN